MPQIGYARCRNATAEPIFVYGPHHAKDSSFLDVSLYLLESGARTPSGWDAKGILIPRGHLRQAMDEPPGRSGGREVLGFQALLDHNEGTAYL
jgi:hypothetical protein